MAAAKKKRGRPPGSKNKPKTGSEAPKRRGRPPGSTNKPQAAVAAPKRRGRPPGSKNRPKPDAEGAQTSVTAPPRRRGRPPGSSRGKAAARSTSQKNSSSQASESAESAQASIAPPLPVVADAPPAVVVAGEPRETVVASVSDLRVDVDAPERRVLIRVRGDLYQRLTLLAKVQNAHFPPDEHLEVSEQASLCLEMGITVCEADPTLMGVHPSREISEDEDYQVALSQACTGRIAEAKA